MKTAQDAAAQLIELADALREIGAGWVVDEIDDVVAQGKSVQLQELPRAEQSHYRERLSAESRKGLKVGRAAAGDEVSIAYTAEERLQLLVDGARRVLETTARSHGYISEFATTHELQVVTLEDPAGLEETADGTDGSSREVRPGRANDIDQHVARLTRVLTEVLG